MEVLFLLVIKHCWIDLGLQPTSYPPGQGKAFYFGKYGHLQHYIPHGLGTVLVLSFFVDPYMALLGGLIDWFCHWHIDYAKTNIRNKFGWKNMDREFWLLNALDQTLHFSTYYLIISIFS
jgi:hypothetical protein